MSGLIKGYTRLFLILSLAVAFPATLRAQVFADRLPADALIYVGWSGSESMPNYAKSHLQHVIADSQFPQLVNDTLPKLLQLAADREPEFAQALPILHDVAAPMLTHPWALYVGKTEIVQGKGPTPHILLVCDAGKESDAMLAQIRKLMGNLEGAPFESRVDSESKLIVVSIGYAKGQPTLAAAGAALAGDAKFKEMMTKAAATPAGVVYFSADNVRQNVDSLVKGIGDDEKAKQWAHWKDQLGLEGLHHLIIAAGFDGASWGTQSFVDMPAPRKGMLANLFEDEPLSDDLVSVIPQTAVEAGGTRLDLSKIVSGIRSLVVAFSPEMQGQFDQVVQQASQIIGMDVEKDLLASFGDQWVYYRDPAIGGYGSLGMVLINRPKDPAQTEARIGTLVSHLQAFVSQQAGPDGPKFTLKKLKVGTVEVTYLATPLITPSWCIDHGLLYFSLYPQVVLTAVQQNTEKPAPLVKSKAFLAVHKACGGVAPSAFEYVDLPAVAHETYPGWLFLSHAAGFADLFGVSSPPLLLPSMPKLLAQLEPAGSFAWSDKAGFHWQSHSPFPGSELLQADPSSMSMAQASMMMSIMLPALNRARESANRVKSASNLRQMGLAGIMYANENKGKLPPKIGDLLKQDISADVFLCPRVSGKSPPPPGLTPEQLADWVDKNSDYVWVGAGKSTSTATSDTVLAYENPNGMQDGLNILYGDGHVEFQMMPIAMEQINKAAQQPKPRGVVGRPARPAAPRVPIRPAPPVAPNPDSQ